MKTSDHEKKKAIARGGSDHKEKKGKKKRKKTAPDKKVREDKEDQGEGVKEDGKENNAAGIGRRGPPPPSFSYQGRSSQQGGPPSSFGGGDPLSSRQTFPTYVDQSLFGAFPDPPGGGGGDNFFGHPPPQSQAKRHPPYPDALKQRQHSQVSFRIVELYLRYFQDLNSVTLVFRSILTEVSCLAAPADRTRKVFSGEGLLISETMALCPTVLLLRPQTHITSPHLLPPRGVTTTRPGRCDS